LTVEAKLRELEEEERRERERLKELKEAVWKELEEELARRVEREIEEYKHMVEEGGQVEEVKEELVEVSEGLKHHSDVWGLEVEKIFGDKALVWLWIDYYETKFEGYLLVPIATLREWLRKDDIPEYYDWGIDYVIGETLVDEDCERDGVVCYRLKNYAPRIFVNPELYAQLRQYITYIPSEWIKAMREGKAYKPQSESEEEVIIQ